MVFTTFFNKKYKEKSLFWPKKKLTLLTCWRQARPLHCWHIAGQWPFKWETYSHLTSHCKTSKTKQAKKKQKCMSHPNDCLKSCKLGRWPLSSFGFTLWQNNFRKKFFLEVLDGYLIILLTIVLKKSMVLDFFFYFEWSSHILHYCLLIQNRKPVIFRSVYEYRNVGIKTTKGLKNSFPKSLF